MKETKSTLLPFLLTFIHQNKLIRLIYKVTSFILRLKKIKIKLCMF